MIGQIMQKLGDKAYIDLKQSEFFSKVKGIKTQQQEMKEDFSYVKTQIERDEKFFQDIGQNNQTKIQGEGQQKVGEYFQAIKTVEEQLDRNAP